MYTYLIKVRIEESTYGVFIYVTRQARHDLFVSNTRCNHVCDMAHFPGHETQKMPNEELWQDKLVYDQESNAFVFDPRGTRKKDVYLDETDVFIRNSDIHIRRILCLIKRAICLWTHKQYLYVHTRINPPTHRYTDTHTSLTHRYTDTHTSLRACTHTHTHTSTCSRVRTHTHMHAYAHMCI